MLLGDFFMARGAKKTEPVNFDKKPSNELIPRDKASHGVNHRLDVVDVGEFVADSLGTCGADVLVSTNAGTLTRFMFWLPPT